VMSSNVSFNLHFLMKALPPIIHHLIFFKVFKAYSVDSAIIT
jgi:hypothetical protein